MNASASCLSTISFCSLKHKHLRNFHTSTYFMQFTPPHFTLMLAWLSGSHHLGRGSDVPEQGRDQQGDGERCHEHDEVAEFSSSSFSSSSSSLLSSCISQTYPHIIILIPQPATTATRRLK
ncbi:unnamed protein product [Pleuronectes platessa]|uniref:Uncharacterized protein n=1 Tax=Pleuronectes platessa TaxID=8262 RepID=A0A9N7TNW7_PLEPL|nr:unnamed protein product [Pleuronectes platessa]